MKNALWNLTDVDRTLASRVRSLRCSASGQLPDPDLRPVSTDRTRSVKKNALWNLTDVDRTLAPRVRSLRFSGSGQLPDPDQRPVSTDRTRPIRKLPL